MEPIQGISVSHFIAQADFVARAILVLMVLASIASWYLICTKAVTLTRMRRRTARFLNFFWNARSLDVVATHLEEKHPDEPFSHLAYHGILASRHHERHGINRLNEAGSSGDFVTRTLRKTIDEETANMESGLTILASVGATAPFVGLLGTVWGIYHALAAISLSGAGTLDKVAGPVGEALIMTAIGLAVAIPAVLGYNFIVRSNRVTLAQLDAFAHDLFTFLGTGAKIESSAPAAVPSLKPAAAAARG
ncbi:MotA/TolQ/ExbB proton channel family protein [Steroidobacter sp.]|uniref:MotA/TolQ/ExbB proton channel family protein n=1 Tax=Steroidobacter sp. TaxID=1978227 RepID=UPI001A3E81CC|nr:MotA/TolQ/ExbB proton channel family protein [Steroidobacter sp.]MBL8269289.1 MotA/TolQ/ExbB proton channel family protein [Steroidobacter sp.]